MKEKVLAAIPICAAIYAAFTLAVGAIAYSLTLASNCRNIASDPVITTGVVTHHWCNRRDNCQTAFRYTVADKVLHDSQRDHDRGRYVGGSIPITYWRADPGVSVAGSFSDSCTDAWAGALAPTVIFPPLPAILMMTAVFAFLVPPEMRKAVYDGRDGEGKRQRLRYPPLYSIAGALIVISAVGAYASWCFAVPGVGDSGKIMGPATIPILIALAAPISIILAYARYRIEIDEVGITVRSLFGSKNLPYSRLAEVAVIKSGRSHALRLRDETERRFADIPRDVGKFRELVDLIVGEASNRGARVNIDKLPRFE